MIPNMISYVFFAMGAFLIGVGLFVWIGKRIDLIHGENAEKVAPEDIGIYSMLTGISVILIALGAIAYGVLGFFPELPVYWQWIAVLALAGLGLLIMLLSRKKYFNN